ncbi:hypothetical protein ACHAWF_000944, partial [Thalassiosira exigua]
NCTNGAIGGDGCCLTCFCPCIALCQAAEKVEEPGPLYFIMPLFGLECCALWMLGSRVEDKRGLKKHSGGWVSSLPHVVL